MEINDKTKILLNYEVKNEEVINKLLRDELNIREVLRELNKNLGEVLVDLSNLKD